jgi:hypothetical protein
MVWHCRPLAILTLVMAALLLNPEQNASKLLANKLEFLPPRATGITPAAFFFDVPGSPHPAWPTERFDAWDRGRRSWCDLSAIQAQTSLSRKPTRFAEINTGAGNRPACTSRQRVAALNPTMRSTSGLAMNLSAVERSVVNIRASP